MDQHPEGRTVSQIEADLTPAPPRRTLQYRLKALVDSKHLIMERTGRSVRYRVPRMADLAVQVVSGSPTISIRVEV
ncbi:hypothetical protein, partial [Methylobacterium crusticola]|uniref:hypothetical protein n=1 Tax=Methylobacterium crusticola TaxID=1697972 RepID=UPI001EE374A7